MSDVCIVFFRDDVCDLEAAVAPLRSYGLTVTPVSNHLVAERPGSPQFRIHFVRGPIVEAEAAEIGAGTPYEAVLGECSARFEISFDDLDEVLDEINTLIEIQGALQEISQGYLFRSWNSTISEPWQG
jgi:hypothetical protein